jgi:hypothetical protein
MIIKNMILTKRQYLWAKYTVVQKTSTSESEYISMQEKFQACIKNFKYNRSKKKGFNACMMHVSYKIQREKNLN